MVDNAVAGSAPHAIIMLDVDGTLVDYENHLPDSAVTAIRKARGNGHRVFICTGRSKAEVYPPLWEIGLDGMIGGNGSYVECDGQVVLHRTLSLEQCRCVVDWLHERRLEFYLEGNDGLFASEGFEHGALKAVRAYNAAKRHEEEGAAITVRSVFPDMIFGAELYRSDVNKISYVLNAYEDSLVAKAHFTDLQHGTWGGKGATALFGDIGVNGITKRYAIDRLLEYLGAERTHTIAFGDATIDISMLEYCAVGVAMGNASDDVKNMADLITDEVGNDGLAHAFRRLSLI
ncbi:MAG: HAD family hydrolase [Bifidobacterium tibiigranuli]|jgi:Cof subfamily protein (haloacid dehalogenase superfamily)|uniref:HAD family hydrolase n=2 Tax=Bifidobacterium tibiigranuli TaxID=2172043 RepID=UPI0026EE34F7|nr:HAD family hydrolase [Bifidobacterium tibiigranuli]MCI2184616.1 HAD family hydrolase [Bifidobacterium tibiigranuli]